MVEGGKVGGECVPHDVVIDVEVRVNDAITHTGDLLPRYAGDLLGKVLEVFGRFADVGNDRFGSMAQ